MVSLLRPAILLWLLLSVLTGLAYPALMTGLARSLFPEASSGSLIRVGGKVVGSELIGQPFDDPRYFTGRPSATLPVPYQAAASSGSNLGPLNPALKEAVAVRVAALRAGNPGMTGPIPSDLVTASGSGLDPHITPAAASWQAPRIARVRGVPVATIQGLVKEHTEGPSSGILGEARVRVLTLNLALDTMDPSSSR